MVNATIFTISGTNIENIEARMASWSRYSCWTKLDYLLEPVNPECYIRKVLDFINDIDTHIYFGKLRAGDYLLLTEPTLNNWQHRTLALALQERITNKLTIYAYLRLGCKFPNSDQLYSEITEEGLVFWVDASLHIDLSCLAKIQRIIPGLEICQSEGILLSEDERWSQFILEVEKHRKDRLREKYGAKLEARRRLTELKEN